MHRDVERRQPVLEDAGDVLVLHVRERREVAVGKGKAVVVVAHVERRAQPFGQPLDEAELALVGAASHTWRLEDYPHRHPLGALELEDELFTVGRRHLEHELVIGGEKLPVEKVLELPPVHRLERGAGENAELGGDGIRENASDFDHREGRDGCAKGHRSSRRAERSSGRRTRLALNMM